jgi:cytidine deaminase
MVMNALESLFEAACAARSRAYAPYSRFPVGAAVRTVSGAVFTGCNVENAAFPVGVCAEAAAIAAMIGAGETRIAEVMVVGDDGPITPCGACRQRIFEFAIPTTIVHCGNAQGTRESVTIRELLPHAFGPEVLAGMRQPSQGRK